MKLLFFRDNTLYFCFSCRQKSYKQPTRIYDDLSTSNLSCWRACVVPSMTLLCLLALLHNGVVSLYRSLTTYLVCILDFSTDTGCARFGRYVLFNATCLTQVQQYGINTKKKLLLVLPRYRYVRFTTSVSYTRFLTSFPSLLPPQTSVCCAYRSLSYPVRWYDIALSTPFTA